MNDAHSLSQWAAHVPPDVVEEAERLWATGMFEDHGNKGFGKFAIRARGFPRAEATCLWLEAVGDLDGPAVSGVFVRYRADRWIPGGTVTCVVGERVHVDTGVCVLGLGGAAGRHL